jgi:hypothetical protein
MFIPSLLSNDFITVMNVQKSEADELAAFFTTQTEGSRKIKDNPDAIPEHLEYLSGNLNLKTLVEDGGLEDLVETLSVSDLRGKRGRRALFLDVENNVIGVGTTVVYNQNWAITGVADPTVMNTVLSAALDAA